MLGWDAMTDVAWDRLFHAYGAATDTPAQLRNLASADPGLQSQCLDYLDGAVLHQGTIWTVTPVAVRVVAGLLGDPSLRRPLPDDNTMRDVVGQLFEQTPDATPVLVPVLGFLASVGDSLAWAWPALPEPLPQASATELDQFYTQLADEDESAWESPVPVVLMCQAVVELRAMAGEVAAAIIPLVHDADLTVRCQAAHAAAQWCRSADPYADVVSTASNAVLARLSTAQGRPERASLVLSAGQLGADVAGFLRDTDEAVRCCAALFVHTDAATGMLIDALTCPDRVNHWFTMADRPPYFSRNVRYRLLDEIINRGVTIDRMLPAGVALIKGSSPFEADAEWGRILKLAFPDPDRGCEPGVRPPLPDRLTEAQKAVVQSVVDNESLWDPKNGNANFARQQVGLPNDRRAVIDYLKHVGSKRRVRGQRWPWSHL